MVAGLCGAGGRDLAVGVKRLLAADRRDDDRGGVSHAEDVDAHVDLADVDEPPRPELEFEEALAVGAQGHFVVDAGGHVAEMRRRHVLPAHRLEIEDVDGLLRRLDEVVRLPRPPHQRIGHHRLGQQRFGQGGRAARSQQRTRGEILQEAAAVRGGIVFG